MKKDDLYFILMLLILISILVFAGFMPAGDKEQTPSETTEAKEQPQMVVAQEIDDLSTLSRAVPEPKPRPAPLPPTETQPEPSETTPETEPVVARVTAYAPFDNQSGTCNDGDPNHTSTGQRPGPTIAAVDPDKIPYGTRFTLEGFDRVFVAGDTGSALRAYDGIAVDIYMETYDEARRWGVQYLKIEVIYDGR
jgi:3D (Asp-Asp-Asp) domain-containing protein